ncbi:hypothetical protein HQK29_13825 [Vibrio vulnificus]|nr:hypothetical protein [Vibrio vulnificus]
MKEVDDNPCMGSKPDSRRLSDIVDLWYSHYGCTLVNGDVIIQKFHHMVKAMGTCCIYVLFQNVFRFPQ